MKIGVLLVSLGFSGLQKGVYSIIASLKKNSEIVLLLNNEILKYFSEIEGIKIVPLGSYRTKTMFHKKRSLAIIKDNLFKALEVYNLDIINIHTSSAMLICYKLPEHLNLPKVVAFHGTDIYNYKYRKNLVYLAYVRPKIKENIKNACKITLVSQNQLQYIPLQYRQKCQVINNGVDQKIYRPFSDLKQEANVVFFAGRFIKIKGIKEIISVAKQLSQYEFWFAGEGPEERLMDLPNVKNLGYKKAVDLVKLYNRSTICIFPSHREGMPNCGLEAMACSRAVIATPMGFSEYIEDNKDGIIIPVRDVLALKNAIESLMSNENKRKALERNAYEKSKKYRWDTAAEKYLMLFEEIVREHKF